MEETFYCLVPGCAYDLTQLSRYHQRHRVCHVHLKANAVEIDGDDHRFCQQCGMFQPLCEFTENRRSCKAALRAHNARRRHSSIASDNNAYQGRIHQTTGSKRSLLSAAAEGASSAKATKRQLERVAFFSNGSCNSAPAVLQSTVADHAGVHRMRSTSSDWASTSDGAWAQEEQQVDKAQSGSPSASYGSAAQEELPKPKHKPRGRKAQQLRLQKQLQQQQEEELQRLQMAFAQQGYTGWGSNCSPALAQLDTLHLLQKAAGSEVSSAGMLQAPAALPSAQEKSGKGRCRLGQTEMHSGGVSASKLHSSTGYAAAAGMLPNWQLPAGLPQIPQPGVQPGPLPAGWLSAAAAITQQQLEQHLQLQAAMQEQQSTGMSAAAWHAGASTGGQAQQQHQQQQEPPMVPAATQDFPAASLTGLWQGDFHAAARQHLLSPQALSSMPAAWQGVFSTACAAAPQGTTQQGAFSASGAAAQQGKFSASGTAQQGAGQQGAFSASCTAAQQGGPVSTQGFSAASMPASWHSDAPVLCQQAAYHGSPCSESDFQAPQRTHSMPTGPQQYPTLHPGALPSLSSANTATLLQAARHAQQQLSPSGMTANWPALCQAALAPALPVRSKVQDNMPAQGFWDQAPSPAAIAAAVEPHLQPLSQHGARQALALAQRTALPVGSKVQDNMPAQGFWDQAPSPAATAAAVEPHLQPLGQHGARQALALAQRTALPGGSKVQDMPAQGSWDQAPSPAAIAAAVEPHLQPLSQHGARQALPLAQRMLVSHQQDSAVSGASMHPHQNTPAQGYTSQGPPAAEVRGQQQQQGGDPDWLDVLTCTEGPETCESGYTPGTGTAGTAAAAAAACRNGGASSRLAAAGVANTGADLPYRSGQGAARFSCTSPGFSMLQTCLTDPDGVDPDLPSDEIDALLDQALEDLFTTQPQVVLAMCRAGSTGTVSDATAALAAPCTSTARNEPL